MYNIKIKALVYRLFLTGIDRDLPSICIIYIEALVYRLVLTGEGR
jgi:hypothetical protein